MALKQAKSTKDHSDGDEQDEGHDAKQQATLHLQEADRLLRSFVLPGITYITSLLFSLCPLQHPILIHFSVLVASREYPLIPVVLQSRSFVSLVFASPYSESVQCQHHVRIRKSLCVILNLYLSHSDYEIMSLFIDRIFLSLLFFFLYLSDFIPLRFGDNWPHFFPVAYPYRSIRVLLWKIVLNRFCFYSILEITVLSYFVFFWFSFWHRLGFRT